MNPHKLNDITPLDILFANTFGDVSQSEDITRIKSLYFPDGKWSAEIVTSDARDLYNLLSDALGEDAVNEADFAHGFDSIGQARSYYVYLHLNDEQALQLKMLLDG